jgi:hypothetical protein
MIGAPDQRFALTRENRSAPAAQRRQQPDLANPPRRVSLDRVTGFRRDAELASEAHEGNARRFAAAMTPRRSRDQVHVAFAVDVIDAHAIGGQALQLCLDLDLDLVEQGRVPAARRRRNRGRKRQRKNPSSRTSAGRRRADRAASRSEGEIAGRVPARGWCAGVPRRAG